MKHYLLTLIGDCYKLEGERYGTICGRAIQRIFKIYPTKLKISISNAPFKGSVRVKRTLFMDEPGTLRHLTCRLFEETILPWACDRLDKDFPQETIYIRVWA